ncbi:leucine-rich repeat domain-containing protein [Yoonia sp. SS1-5]|uniref:Leucine-rich repeat domain-containing protein n=1 Tax=Yoonia rhodophyticola TaxID=3137370 RepID=A0AAN0MHR1_9RHOB
MSDADKAYARAQKMIARAKQDGLDELDFDTHETHALTTVPPEIADLTNLTGVDLSNTQVSDLSPIAGLTALTKLHLSNTPVTDLSAIAGLTGLTELNLNNTPVSDLTHIAGLTGLTGLGLNNTQVSDLTHVAGLKGLMGLGLANTQMSDLTHVAGLKGLTELYLNNTQVSDLTHLAGLRGLRVLELDDTQVSDLAPLLGLEELVLNPKIFGLSFSRTPAADSDPRIAKIAEIPNNAERARALFDYLDPDWENRTNPPKALSIDGILRGPILSDTLADVTKQQDHFEATTLTERPDKDPDEKFQSIVETLQLASRKLGATDVQNRLGRDVAESFREYRNFVRQEALNPRILKYLSDSIRGAISSADTVEALDGFDLPLINGFLEENDALLNGYFAHSIAPPSFEIDTDPDMLARELFPQLDAASKILADADAGLFAPSVSDALEMLHRRAEGARKGLITLPDGPERDAAVAELRRTAVLVTSYLGRIKGRLTQWVAKQGDHVKENPATSAATVATLVPAAIWVVAQIGPVFEKLWRLIGNLPLPF